MAHRQTCPLRLSTILRLSNEVLLMILELLYYIDKDLNMHGQEQGLLACRATC
jgi:hypothetical protein